MSCTNEWAIIYRWLKPKQYRWNCSQKTDGLFRLEWRDVRAYYLQRPVELTVHTSRHQNSIFFQWVNMATRYQIPARRCSHLRVSYNPNSIMFWWNHARAMVNTHFWSSIKNPREIMGNRLHSEARFMRWQLKPWRYKTRMEVERSRNVPDICEKCVHKLGGDHEGVIVKLCQFSLIRPGSRIGNSCRGFCDSSARTKDLHY